LESATVLDKTSQSKIPLLGWGSPSLGLGIEAGAAQPQTKAVRPQGRATRPTGADAAKQVIASQRIARPPEAAGPKKTSSTEKKGPMKKQMCILVLALLSLVACQETKIEEQPQKMSWQAQRPFQDIDIPFEEYEIDADQDTVLVLPQGGVFYFKGGALRQANGDTVYGKVSLKYRIFHDAPSAFLAGMPMTYEAQGKKQYMATAGMFELRAEQNGVQLKMGEAMKIKTPSFQKEGNYSFFHLSEEDGKWEYLDQEYEIEENTSKQKALKKVKNKAKNILKMPLEAKYFCFDYSAILDVTYNDDYSQIYKNRENPVVGQKAHKYGLSWLNSRCYKSIEYKGSTEPAAMIVWKRLSGGRFPVWAKDKDFDALELELIRGNIYRLTLNSHDGREEWSGRIEAVMPLKQLYRYSPKSWASNYEKNMAEIEVEMQRLRQEADLFRSFEISDFGIYNYDRFLKWEDAQPIVAQFEIDGGDLLASFKLEKVFCFPLNEASLIDLPARDWNKIRLHPDRPLRFLAILPNEQIALFDLDDFSAIDWAEIEGRPADEPYRIVLQVQEGQVKTVADVEQLFAPKLAVR